MEFCEIRRNNAFCKNSSLLILLMLLFGILHIFSGKIGSNRKFKKLRLSFLGCVNWKVKGCLLFSIYFRKTLSKKVDIYIRD